MTPAESLNWGRYCESYWALLRGEMPGAWDLLVGDGLGRGCTRFAPSGVLVLSRPGPLRKFDLGHSLLARGEVAAVIQEVAQAFATEFQPCTGGAA